MSCCSQYVINAMVFESRALGRQGLCHHCWELIPALQILLRTQVGHVPDPSECPFASILYWTVPGSMAMECL